jgi:hypothetical protein
MLLLVRMVMTAMVSVVDGGKEMMKKKSGRGLMCAAST